MIIMMSSRLRGTVMIVVLSPDRIKFLLEVKRKIAQQNMKLCKTLLMRDETAFFFSWSEIFSLRGPPPARLPLSINI